MIADSGLKGPSSFLIMIYGRAGGTKIINGRRARPNPVRLMMYFWFIPALLLLVVLLWMFYAGATKRVPHRTEGRTIVDKNSDRPANGPQP